MIARRCHGLLTALVVLSAAPAPAGPQAPTEPWEAIDYLESGSARAAPGWRVEAGLSTWEALPGELESVAAGGFEPATGLGFRAGWRRRWHGTGAPTDGVDGTVLIRSLACRLAVGAGTQIRQGRRSGELRFQVDARVASLLLAGARLEADPVRIARTSDLVLVLHAGGAGWLGGLQIGPSSERFRIALGMRLRSNLVWSVSYEPGLPGSGIALALGGTELRAEHIAHPILGGVSRVRLVRGGF